MTRNEIFKSEYHPKEENRRKYILSQFIQFFKRKQKKVKVFSHKREVLREIAGYLPNVAPVM